MSKISEWIKRNILSETLLLLLIAGAAAAYFVVYPKVVEYTKAQDLKELNKLRVEHEELKEKYENVEADRDNILEQTKGLLQEKAKWVEIGEELEELKKQNEIFLAQKDKIHQDNQKLKKELADVVDHFDRLKETYQDLQIRHDKMDTENSKMRMLIGKSVESAPQFQKLAQDADELKRQNTLQSETIKDLQDKLKKVLLRLKKIQDRDIRFAKTARSYRRYLHNLAAEKNYLLKTNQALNKTVIGAPKRMTDMAKQNNSLIKETSEMHYNLGVLFLKNKNYEQAVREFKRALDFDPSNARVHYNLGYLFAEELGSHREAIAHFKKYLELDPGSAQAESIKSYILTWETYGQTVQK